MNSRRNFVSMFFFWGWMACALSVHAQSPLENLAVLEAEAIGFQERMASASTDVERSALHDSLRMVFSEALSIPESFSYPFSGLKYMANLRSDDGRVRILNWNVPFDDGTHTYGAFVQWADDAKKIAALNWIELTPSQRLDPGYTNKYLTPEKWKGALYYEIITVGKKRDAYYLLLGWDGADGLINRKIIEPLEVKGDKLRFGAPVFKVEKGSPKRFVMEYGDDVSASLRYRKSESRIVFDHLAPRQQGLEGNPAFYGPDLTFDAFVFDKGQWQFQSNVDVTLSKEDSARPWIDPQRR